MKVAPQDEKVYHMEHFNHTTSGICPSFGTPNFKPVDPPNFKRSETAFGIRGKAWNTKSFVHVMKPRFYMAITCFATQIVSINLLKKRTLLPN